MRQNKEHKLVTEDAELFNAMRGKYFSNNERVFFERLQDKEEHEFTVSNDLLLYEGTMRNTSILSDVSLRNILSVMVSMGIMTRSVTRCVFLML